MVFFLINASLSTSLAHPHHIFYFSILNRRGKRARLCQDRRAPGLPVAYLTSCSVLHHILRLEFLYSAIHGQGRNALRCCSVTYSNAPDLVEANWLAASSGLNAVRQSFPHPDTICVMTRAMQNPKSKASKGLLWNGNFS